MAEEIVLSGYIPGAIGRITELHARYYRDNWGFGLFFESKVATELAEFLGRYDDSRDLFRVATRGELIVGAISIDGSGGPADDGGGEARLRWFITAPEAQGAGVGRMLMDEAIGFCKRARFDRIYLWTFAGLDAARHLYESSGFRLVEEHDDDQWGETVSEQKFVLDLQ